MDPTALRSFLEVCRRGSLSAAAQSLGYTQSALSRQVAALESRLGTPLLRRQARGVRPTPAGEVLREHAAVILARLDRAAEEVAAAGQHPIRHLRVGAVPTASAALLPAALTAFTAAEPTVRVEFAEDVSPALLPRLADRDLDVAVVTDYPPGLPTHRDLRLVHLLDDDLLCALPPDHRLATRKVLTLSDLSTDSWVEDYAGAAAILTGACARAGFSPRIDIACGGWLGKQAFVAAGHGVMLVPRLLLPALRPDLAIRPLTDPPRRTVYAALHNPTTRTDPSTGPAGAFVRALSTVSATPVGP